MNQGANEPDVLSVNSSPFYPLSISIDSKEYDVPPNYEVKKGVKFVRGSTRVGTNDSWTHFPSLRTRIFSKWRSWPNQGLILGLTLKFDFRFLAALRSSLYFWGFGPTLSMIRWFLRPFGVSPFEQGQLFWVSTISSLMSISYCNTKAGLSLRKKWNKDFFGHWTKGKKWRWSEIASKIICIELTHTWWKKQIALWAHVFVPSFRPNIGIPQFHSRDRIFQIFQSISELFPGLTTLEGNPWCLGEVFLCETSRTGNVSGNLVWFAK